MRKHYETSSEANKKRMHKKRMYTIHPGLPISEVVHLVMALGVPPSVYVALGRLPERFLGQQEEPLP